MQTIKPTILLLDPPALPLEDAFFTGVAETLAKRGVELCLIVARETPLAGVRVMDSPYWLDELGAPFAPFSPRVAGQDVDELFALEDAFRGPAREPSLRKGALALMESLFAQTLLALRPSLVVLWNGQRARHRILRSLLEPCGCPVLLAERAPLPGFLYFDHRGLMCDASFAKQEVSWAGEEEKRVWLDRFAGCEQGVAGGGTTWHDQPQVRAATDLRRKYGIPPHARVVFYPEQLDTDTQNILFSPRFSGSLDALQHLLRLLAPVPDLFIVGKGHPKSTVDPAVFEHALRGRGAWLRGVSIDDALRLADFVAGVNSSVLFEAMCRQKPVLAMGRTLIEGRGAFYELGDDETGAIQKWLGRDDWEARCARWQEVGAWLICNHFYSLAARPAGLMGCSDAAERLLSAFPGSAPDYSHLVSFCADLPAMYRHYAKALRIVEHPAVRAARRVSKFLRRMTGR